MRSSLLSLPFFDGTSTDLRVMVQEVLESSSEVLMNFFPQLAKLIFTQKKKLVSQKQNKKDLAN
jgi:hypothetical protein